MSILSTNDFSLVSFTAFKLLFKILIFGLYEFEFEILKIQYYIQLLNLTHNPEIKGSNPAAGTLDEWPEQKWADFSQ